MDSIVEKMNELNRQRSEHLRQVDLLAQELLRLDGVVRYLKEKEKSENVPA